MLWVTCVASILMSHTINLSGLNDVDVMSFTWVVWMMVRSFMRETPGPIGALRPAVPNSIRTPKHVWSSSTAPSFSKPLTAELVFGFWFNKTKVDKKERKREIKRIIQNILMPYVMSYFHIVFTYERKSLREIKEYLPWWNLKDNGKFSSPTITDIPPTPKAFLVMTKLA